MAVTKQQVILEFDADTGELLKATKAVEDSVEGVGTAAKKSGDDLSDMGKTGSSAFKGIGTALKATGIGLLVGLLAKLAMKFAENKKVADTLAVAGAALGTVFNDIVDLGIRLGETVASAFTDPKQAVIDLKDAIVDNITNRITGLLNLLPSLGEAINLVFKGKFKEAGKVALDAAAQVTLGVTDFTDKVSEAADAVTDYAGAVADSVKESSQLERQLQKLRDAERDLSVETARSRAEVEELKRQRDDQTLSIEQRLEASQKAAAIDKAIADENVRIQEQKAALLRQEIELQGETEERLNGLAEAEIAAADARQQSATVQTELQNSIFALNEEIKAQEEEAQQAADDALKAEEERLAEEQKLKDEAAKKDKERRDKDLADEKALQDQKRAMTFAALSALADLSNAFAKNNEEGARRAFKRNKALSLASAVLNTSQAITDALAKDATFPGSRFIAAATAGAAGLAQIQNIRKTQFQGSNPPPPATEDRGPAGGFAAGAVNAPGAPALDLGFLGEGAQGAPIRAYVIAQNVSNAQQANQQVQDQATLGG